MLQQYVLVALILGTNLSMGTAVEVNQDRLCEVPQGADPSWLADRFPEPGRFEAPAYLSWVEKYPDHAWADINELAEAMADEGEMIGGFLDHDRQTGVIVLDPEAGFSELAQRIAESYEGLFPFEIRPGCLSTSQAASLISSIARWDWHPDLGESGQIAVGPFVSSGGKIRVDFSDPATTEEAAALVDYLGDEAWKVVIFINGHVFESDDETTSRPSIDTLSPATATATSSSLGTDSSIDTASVGEGESRGVVDNSNTGSSALAVLAAAFVLFAVISGAFTAIRRRRNPARVANDV